MIGRIIKDSCRFTQLPVSALYPNSHSDFDLFIRIRGQLMLYASSGYYWEIEEITTLSQSGHNNLLLREEDVSKMQVYLSLGHLGSINNCLPPNQRLKRIEGVGADFIYCLHQGEITESCTRKAEKIGSSITDCIMEKPDCIRELEDVGRVDFYTYFHGIRVAAYSVAIALELGISRRKTLTNIALGGIFHDIGKKCIASEVLNKPRPLNDNETISMQTHSQLGFKLMEKTIDSHTPKEIILHHHERLDGSGYPDGLSKHSLMIEVQIAGLADIFDALTSVRCYEKSLGKFEALTVIKDRFVGGHVSPDAFKALVSCLA